MKLILLSVIAFTTIAFEARTAQAIAKVGDDFKAKFRAVDGSTVDTESLKGRILVVDFWATWCGPCMGMVPHMVEMNQKYSAKGLQIIGISLDQDQSSLLRVTKEKGMSWPEDFTGGSDKIVQQYCGEGIPFTVLVSPAGKVLYAGHPAAGLDGAIEKAFKETPPQLVDPQVLSQATSDLDEIEKKIASGDAKGAIKLLSKIPASAKADGKVAGRADAAQKKVEEAANSMLAAVQTQIDQEKYPEAVARLKELSDALSGLPESAKARSMLSSLMSNPKAKSAMAAAERSAKANDALAIAENLQAQKKDELAYARFTDVVRLYAGSPAASLAQEQVDRYQKDTAFIKRVNEKAAASKAISALHMGDSYRAAGNSEMARKKYQSVVDEFPGTSYAELAKKALAEIGPQ
ncbi:MAG TPA: redoxin family protein [Tepidisphaeraceae bacterium]|nr:redoxin family protein [Tepidisphaeraceae bacterium]